MAAEAANSLAIVEFHKNNDISCGLGASILNNGQIKRSGEGSSESTASSHYMDHEHGYWDLATTPGDLHRLNQNRNENKVIKCLFVFLKFK